MIVISHCNSRMFITICKLTLARDYKELSTLVASGSDINTMLEDYSPVGYFATTNDKQSVDFLLDHFNANLKDAVLCAAWGCHFDLMHHLLDI